MELPGLREGNQVVLALLHTGGAALAAVAVLVVTDINPGGSQGHREGGDQHHHHVQPGVLKYLLILIMINYHSTLQRYFQELKSISKHFLGIFKN